MLNDAATPVIALSEDVGSGRDAYVRAAARAGWGCVTFGYGSQPASLRPTLIIVAAGSPDRLAARRDASAPGAGLIAASNATVAHADEALFLDASDAVLDALLARWRPLPLPEAVERQIAVFGAEQIIPLLVRLRERLAWIVSADPATARPAAHQLAGIAGILAFADVAARWETVSLEGESALTDARREARRAIAALDRSGLCAAGR